jgi:hypothetical protein
MDGIPSALETHFNPEQPALSPGRALASRGTTNTARMAIITSRHQPLRNTMALPLPIETALRSWLRQRPQDHTHHNQRGRKSWRHHGPPAPIIEQNQVDRALPHAKRRP